MSGDAEDGLDEVYAAAPADFIGVRRRLADEAKRSGDKATAARFSAARKPTTAAWVVNRLVIADPDVRARLGELGERLRSAHETLDGAQMRELSAEQRRVVDEASRQAFDGAGLADPSAAVREDVVATLHAAIADPDVLARLGRLTKPESWSGFGFPGAAVRSESTAEKPTKDAHRRAVARDVVSAAEERHRQAEAAAAERREELASAQRALKQAQRAVSAAESALAEAEQASGDAAAVLAEARAQLAQLG